MSKLELLEKVVEHYRKQLCMYCVNRDKCSNVKDECKVEELVTYMKELEEIKNQKYIMSISCHGECHICEYYKNEYLVEQKIEEIEKRNYNDFTREQDGNQVKQDILNEFKKILESE